MNKWLVGLVLAAVVLPLLIFVGNLKVEIPQGGTNSIEEASPSAAVAEKSAAPGNISDESLATPEIYLGYQFARVNLGNDEGFQPEQAVAYVAPSDYGSIVPNAVYLGGLWKNTPDSMELVSDEGRITLKYTAKAVNIVAGPGQQPALLQVILDGDFVDSTNSGSDVRKSLATVDGQRLYNLVMDDGYHTKVVEVNAKGKGFRLYTFTFG